MGAALMLFDILTIAGAVLLFGVASVYGFALLVAWVEMRIEGAHDE